MGILDPGPVDGPLGRILSRDTAESCLQVLVGALGQPIGLGVEA